MFAHKNMAMTTVNVSEFSSLSPTAITHLYQLYRRCYPARMPFMLMLYIYILVIFLIEFLGQPLALGLLSYRYRPKGFRNSFKRSVAMRMPLHQSLKSFSFPVNSLILINPSFLPPLMIISVSTSISILSISL